MAGPIGFFKGLGARVLYSMPATAICWSTYEFFKFILSNKSNEYYRSSVSSSNVSPSKSLEKTRNSTAEEHSPNVRYVNIDREFGVGVLNMNTPHSFSDSSIR